MNSKLTRKQKQELATAYHEIGHALACIACEKDFKYVTITPTKDYLGYLQHDEKPLYHLKKLKDVSPYLLEKINIEKAIIISIAGVYAEKTFTNRFNRIGAGSDYQKIIDLIFTIYYPNESAARYFFKYCEAMAKGLFKNDSQQKTLGELSSLLYEKKTLTKAEIMKKLYGLP